MSPPFWLRPLRLLDKPAESVSKAALNGDSLEVLLRRAAGSLLENLHADRAGVWASDASGGHVWHGQVAESEDLGSGLETSSINAFEVFPVEFNDANSPVEFFAPVFPAGPQQFFEGISTAIGMPLKVDDRLLGALLAGSIKPGKLAGRDVVENVSAEIALALYAIHARQRQERTSKSLHLREEIDRLIAHGAAAESVISRILNAAVNETGAQFAGIARRLDTSLEWEVLSGSDPRDSLQPAFFEIATAVFLEGESIIRDIAGPIPGLSVVGLPLDSSNHKSVLLLAGYRRGEKLPLEALENFRTMIAIARCASLARHNDSAYRALFESSGEALVVTDASGKILQANRFARELLLWKSDLGPEINLSEFFIHPNPVELAAWFERAAAGACAPSVEAQVESGLEVRLTLRQSLRGSARLLVALEEGPVVRRADRQWKQTQAELSSLLDALQCGVMFVSPDGRIRAINSQFALLFGLEAGSAQSIETLDELAQAVDPRLRNSAAYRAPWDAFISGSGEATHDELNVTSRGERVLERYARPVLNDKGWRLGWLEIVRDVTDQRQLQAQLLQTEKIAAVGQLAPGMAHELNNPLTSIMGYAQLLLHKMEGRHEEVKMIFEEAERARRIVKNLLSFARPVAEERTRSNVNEIIERTFALRNYELKVQNIEVRSELDPQLPETFADAHQIQQLVLNLVMNAEQAVAGNSRKPKIHVRTKRLSSDRLAIEISDNGPGVRPEIASRIFDPYFTTKPVGVGTGLGLPIVRSMAEQQGGKVSFENLSQHGAKFIVELPIVPVPAIESAKIDDTVIETAKKISSARILIVEDEPTVAHFIADVLREDGHRVEAVLDSEEALTRAMRTNYDLIICDLRMPRVDGPAFYDALIRGRHTSRHRILFITGDTLGPRTIEFLQSRQLHYLAKPFLVEELKVAAYRVLEGDAVHPSAAAIAQANK